MINYITIKKFCEDTGYSEEAIRSKINRGDWQLGKEYTKAQDTRILINIEGYHAWVERNIQESEQSANRQSRLTSTIAAKDAGNESHLSPRPLT